MLKKFTNVIVLLFVGDMLLTQLALYLADVIRLNVPLGRPILPTDTFLNPYIHVMVALIWPLFFTALSVYNIRRATNPVGEAKTLLIAVPTAIFVFSGALYLSFRDVPRLLVFYFFLLDLFWLAAFRLGVGLSLCLLKKWGHHLNRVLIVGNGESGAAIAQAVEAELGLGFSLVGFTDDEREPGERGPLGLPILGRIDDTADIVQREEVQEVIIALPSADYARVEQVVYDLQTLPVRIRIVPDFFKLIMVRSNIESVSGIPLIGVREPVIEGVDWVVKRTFDLSLSALAILFLWPWMLLVALLIKLDSEGPVIFKQQRVGENGKFFWMYKFRTMVEGADKAQGEVEAVDEDGRPIYKVKDDPRVTRPGRLLRRTSLDELPQLFNVLKGEMSLVGPRPEQRFIVEQYESWQRQRLAVPPGITGWWQVNGRSDQPMHLNTQYDLFYIRHYSLFLDLKILWKTVGALIKGKGAY